MNYLPLVIIGIYIVFAIIIKLINKPEIAKALSMLASGIGSVLSIVLLMHVIQNGVLRVNLLDQIHPYNLDMVVGIMEAMILLTFSAISFFVTWASTSLISYDVPERNFNMYYVLSTLLIGTICGIVIFDNLINMYIFVELSAFVSAATIIIKNEPENRRAALKYVTLSIMGSAFILVGMVIMNNMTGSFTMEVIRKQIPAVYEQHPWAVFFALGGMTIGGAFKSALFPFHIWLPSAHTYAPAPTSALLSGLVPKPYIIFYINICYRMIGSELMKTAPLCYILDFILWCGIAGMVLGSIFAMMQTDIKKVTAYSSVAQIGYIYMGVGLGSQLGLVAAVYHIITHAITKAMLFCTIGSIAYQTHNRNIPKMAGLGIEMPVTLATFTIGSLSMIGVPLFMGFVSKYNFALGIMQTNKVWVIFILVLSGLMNAIYYLPVCLRGFFGPAAQEKYDQGLLGSKERKFMQILPIIVLCVAVVFFGLFSTKIIELITIGVPF